MPKGKPSSCRECPLYNSEQVPYRAGKSTDILIVGQSPGRDEVQAGKPFVGPSGKLLDSMLSLVGIDRNDLWIANTLRCREFAPLLGVELTKARECCRPFLDVAIEQLNPKLIVALGAYALKQLLNKDKITTKRGKFYENGANSKVFVILHPAAVIRECTKGYPNKKFSDMNMREKSFYFDFKLLKAYIDNGFKEPTIDTSAYVKGTDADLKRIADAPLVAVDFETNGKDLHDPSVRVLSVSFSIEKGKSYVYLLKTKKAIRNVAKALQSNNLKLVAARPFEEQVCRKLLGFNMEGKVLDILVLAHLLDENYFKFNLETVASVYAGMRNIKDLAEGMRSNLEEASEDILVRYNGVDSDATLSSGDTIITSLDGEPRLSNYLVHFIHPVQNMLCEIVENGCKIDIDVLRANEETALNALDDYKDAILSKLPQRLLDKYKDNLNPTRDALIREALFVSFRCKPILFTGKTKQPQTSEEHIKMFINHKRAGPFVRSLLDWKVLYTVHSRYIKPLWGHIKADGRIYPTTPLNRTVTGRSSMVNPPIQNFPQRSKHANLIRECVVADDGWLLGARDLSQSELKIMGWLAGDENILRPVRAGVDLHIRTAAMLNGIPIEEVTSEMRRKAKGVNFGLIYGMSAQGLRNYLRDEYGIEVSEAEAVSIRTKFFSYPNGYYRLPMLYAKIIQGTRQKGYTETLLGRRRRLPGINSREQGLAKSAERMAVNMHGQSFSSDLAFIGKLLFHKDIKHRKLTKYIKPMWFIHDNILFTAKEDYMDMAQDMLKEAMEVRSVEYIRTHFGVTIGYPVTTDKKVGKSWQTLK